MNNDNTTTTAGDAKVLSFDSTTGTTRYVRMAQFLAQWFDDKPTDAFTITNVMELAIDLGREVDLYITSVAASSPAPKPLYKTGVYKVNTNGSLTLVAHKFEDWDGRFV